ncbi:hypothetical protein FJY90_02850 [Candidatus Gottesmanbacteria bacterium]|nr:hypothetical protein [Candidatus Gottesmanbacteria bacterium]
MPDENTPQLNLEEVVALEPDKLSDEQRSFLEENKANLTDEQLEKFGLTKDLNPDEIEPETRYPSKKEEKPPTGEDENGKDEDEIDPDDERTIVRVVNKQMEALKGRFAEVDRLKDETEVDAFLRDNKDYTKYRAIILKYMTHPAYKNIPVGHIATIVSAKDQQRLGAQKERDAQKKAKETQSGGSPVRKPSKEFNWSTATKEEFEAQKAKILGRQGI